MLTNLRKYPIKPAVSFSVSQFYRGRRVAHTHTGWGSDRHHCQNNKLLHIIMCFVGKKRERETRGEEIVILCAGDPKCVLLSFVDRNRERKGKRNGEGTPCRK